PHARRSGQRGQHLGQGREQRRELVLVRAREAREQRLAARRERELDLAPVLARTAAAQEAALLEAIGELDRTVVAQLQPLGEHADRRAPVEREALHREQQLVLLRGEPGGARRGLAEAQEQAHAVAELREGAVLGCVRCGCARRARARTAWGHIAVRYI